MLPRVQPCCCGKSDRGKHNAVIVEGLHSPCGSAGSDEDVVEYVKRIRALRWLAMALRAQETAQVRC